MHVLTFVGSEYFSIKICSSNGCVKMTVTSGNWTKEKENELPKPLF